MNRFQQLVHQLTFRTSLGHTVLRPSPISLRRGERIVCRVKKTLIVLLGVALLSSPAAAQRIGIYPLEVSDQTLALAVPTAVSRVLETVDGAILPTPIELLQAVKRRAAFQAKLSEVFALSTLITGKLEGSAGNYTATYTLKSGANAQTVTVKGADFQKLVVASDAALLKALGLKPSSADSAEIAAIEKSIPSAEIVTASTVPLEDTSAAILEKAGDVPWALIGRALALIQAGKNAEALPLAVSAAKLAPSDPTVLTTLGLVQLSNRNNAESKTAIDVGLKLNPAKPELDYLLGRYTLRATAPLTPAAVQSALASLERALQYNPRFLEAAVIAADLHERLGDAQGSLDVLFNLVPRMPDEVALHNRILDLLVNTDRDNATAYLRQILRTYPDVPDTVYALAGRLYDTDIAVSIVADGEKRYATSAPLANTRGNLLERKTQYEDAVKAYKEALGRDKTLQRAGLSLAGALSKLGRFDEAEATIQQTFGRVDQKLLTRMYLQTGRYDRAKTVLDKLSSTAATDADVPYYQGIMFLRQYQTDDARKQLEAAVKIKPDDTRARTTLPELPDAQRLGVPKLTGPALYPLQLAQSLLDNGNPLEAAQVLENALKTSPTDLHLNFYYAYAQYQIKDPDEAVDQFTATLKLAPDNVVVMAFLAATYISNGRFDLAIDTANKAIAKDPKYGRAYFVLALANYTLGNAGPARDAFLKTIGVNADFKILIDPYLAVLPK